MNHTTSVWVSDCRRSQQRSDDADAFFPDPLRRGPALRAAVRDPVAEALAQDFVACATSCEEVTENFRDDMSIEELGGPFLETTLREECGRTLEDDVPLI